MTPEPRPAKDAADTVIKIPRNNNFQASWKARKAEGKVPKSQYVLKYLIYTLVAAIMLTILTESYLYAKASQQARYDFRSFVFVLIALPLLLGLLSSLAFSFFMARRTEEEMREETHRRLENTLLQTARELHNEFVPVGHFSISNEGDPAFLEAIEADLLKSTFFFFSGLSARVAVMRVYKVRNQVLENVLLRIPLSEESLKRAVDIRLSVSSMKTRVRAVARSSNEFEGMDQDPEHLRRLAKSKEPADSSQYIKLLGREAILLAYRVARELNATFVIKDWDETVEFRIEMMDPSLFLGNYHLHGDITRFSPGTTQFGCTSFMYKLLRKSISTQIEVAKSTKDGSVLLIDKVTRLDDVIKFVKAFPDTQSSSEVTQDHRLVFDASIDQQAIDETFQHYSKVFDLGVSQ